VGEGLVSEQGAILIVEDDADTRAFVREVLAEAAYDVREAADGREALDALHRARPAGIVLDLALPFVPGTDVARASRSLYEGSVPVVVISAGREAEADARDVGASGLLRKPFLAEELEAVLGRALAGREALTASEREIADRRALEADASRERLPAQPV